MASLVSIINIRNFKLHIMKSRITNRTDYTI